MGDQYHPNYYSFNSNRDKMAESRVPMTMRDFFFDDPFFKSSWDDFEQVREKMFQESRDMWKKFDEDFRSMACMSNNIMIDSDIQEKKNTELNHHLKTEAWTDRTPWPSGRTAGCSQGGGCFPVLRVSSRTWICSRRWRSAWTPPSTDQMS